LPQWHGDLHKRKKTGGKKKPYREKRAYEMGSDPTETKIGERKISIERCRGGNIKVKLLACNVANVTDPLTGKTQKTEIKKVIKNPANIDYQRRGIITKGSIIETPLGLAKVTSRPGQHGIINAILIQKA